jgi:hypothetical protein
VKKMEAAAEERRLQEKRLISVRMAEVLSHSWRLWTDLVGAHFLQARCRVMEEARQAVEEEEGRNLDSEVMRAAGEDSRLKKQAAAGTSSPSSSAAAQKARAVEEEKSRAKTQATAAGLKGQYMAKLDTFENLSTKMDVVQKQKEELAKRREAQKLADRDAQQKKRRDLSLKETQREQKTILAEAEARRKAAEAAVVKKEAEAILRADEEARRYGLGR